MQENSISTVKKYITPSYSTVVVGIIISVLSILWFVISAITIDMDRTKEIIIGSVTLIMGLFLTSWELAFIHQANKSLSIIENNGEMQILLNDFKNGSQYFKGSLILGQKFVIGKNSGTVLAYTDVVRIYQYVHKTNFFEDMRVFKAVNNKRNVINVCPLPLRGKGDCEFNTAANIILSKNPNVKVGL